MFPYNLASSIVFALASIYIIRECSTFPPPESPGVNAAYWPALLGWGMLLLSVGLLAETLIKRVLVRNVAGGGLAPDKPAPFDFRSRGMLHVSVLCLIFLVFSLLLHYLNFLAASVFLIPACMLLLGEKRPFMLVSVTVGIPLLIHIIFARILGIMLP